MINNFSIAPLNNESLCLSVDFDNDNDVSEYVLNKRIYTTSTMDGLYSETCLDTQR